MKRRQSPSAEQVVLMSRRNGVQTAQGKSLALVCTKERTFGFAPIPVIQFASATRSKQTSRDVVCAASDAPTVASLPKADDATIFFR